jgi:membrane-associated protease RseP (regulator of RpoE activity)
MSETEGVKTVSGAWMAVLSTYRLFFTGGTEIVVGELEEGLDPRDPDVQRALEGWGGKTYLAPEGGESSVVLTRASQTPPSRPWLVHGLLLLATLLTTHMAGALLSGVDPMGTDFVEIAGVWIPVPTTIDWARLAVGAPFAMTLMGILMAHELGHFFAAKWNGVWASLPYFVPFPAYYSAIGTLGAFIRIRGPIVRRAGLLDIGVAGPAVSFIGSLVLLAVGLPLSSVVPGSSSQWLPFIIEFGGQPISIGSGPLVHAMAYLVFPGNLGVNPILLHPIAFAAWVGLFVTFLNLLPFGQLDGGHILYALSDRVQRLASVLFLVALLPAGWLWWGWWLWGGLVLVLSRGRLAHPRVMQPQVPLGLRRRWVVGLSILVFVITFIPVPIQL